MVVFYSSFFAWIGTDPWDVLGDLLYGLITHIQAVLLAQCRRWSTRLRSVHLAEWPCVEVGQSSEPLFCRYCQLEESFKVLFESWMIAYFK
jgi:hypothetical protein